MDIIVLLLIIIGAIVMVGNIIVYIMFMLKMRDVISGGVKPDNAMLVLGLILIIFFLGGYIFILVKSEVNLMIALVLFFGSFFVSLSILLMNKLIKTTKSRSLEIAQVLISIMDSYGPNIKGHSLHVKNLMVTFFVGISSILFLIGFLLVENIYLFVLFLITLCLFIPYIFHYYYLENGTQKLYELYLNKRAY